MNKKDSGTVMKKPGLKTSSSSRLKSKVQVQSRRVNGSGQIVIQYVLPVGNGWVVKTNTATKFLIITDSKREAISYARNLARTKKSGLIVHGKDGKIEIQESYAVG